MGGSWERRPLHPHLASRVPSSPLPSPLPPPLPFFHSLIFLPSTSPCSYALPQLGPGCARHRPRRWQVRKELRPWRAEFSCQGRFFFFFCTAFNLSAPCITYTHARPRRAHAHRQSLFPRRGGTRRQPERFPSESKGTQGFQASGIFPRSENLTTHLYVSFPPASPSLSPFLWSEGMAFVRLFKKMYI